MPPSAMNSEPVEKLASSEATKEHHPGDLLGVGRSTVA
jgi:hypothetical protein